MLCLPLRFGKRNFRRTKTHNFFCTIDSYEAFQNLFFSLFNCRENVEEEKTCISGLTYIFAFSDYKKKGFEKHWFVSMIAFCCFFLHAHFFPLLYSSKVHTDSHRTITINQIKIKNSQRFCRFPLINLSNDNNEIIHSARFRILVYDVSDVWWSTTLMFSFHFVFLASFSFI